LLLLMTALVLVLPWLETEEDQSGQPPFGFFLIIILGFMLLADARVGRTIDRDWVWLLGVGLVASVVYIWAEPRAGAWGDDWGHEDTVYVAMKTLYEIGVWGMMLGLLGLGHRFLMGGGHVLKYSTEAAYPFYILHQTVIVGVAYVVCGWDWPAAAKFFIVAAVSLGLTLAIYEVVVRRWGPVRFLFGMKPKKRPAPAAPPEPVPPPAPAS
jgi:peptidoglycan/LPS O-acetylase OafA/YrhL